MVRPRTFALGSFVVVLLLMGTWLGFRLAEQPRLVPFKLLNVAGGIYGLVGLIVLSELVATSERIKEFMVKWVTVTVLWATSVIPLGGLIGCAIGYALPSSSIASKFFGTFFSYSLLALVVLDTTVASPLLASRLSVAKRHQILGLLLLISGAIAQLIAAFQDLSP